MSSKLNYVDPCGQDICPDLKNRITNMLLVFSFTFYLLLLLILIIITGDLPSLVNCVGLFIAVISLCIAGCNLIQRLIFLVVLDIVVNLDGIQIAVSQNAEKGMKNEP